MKTIKYNWNILSKYRNVLYGLAALSIIAYHFTSIFKYFPDYQRPTWATVYFNFIGSIGVEIFVFLAGVFCYFSYEKASDTKEFIKKRILKILPPYTLVGLVFWGLEYIFFGNWDSFGFIQDFTFVSFFTKGENRFWFVLAILVFYTVYPLIREKILSSNNSLIKILLVILCIIVSMYLIKDTHFFRCTQIAVTRIPIFLVGCYFGKKVFENDNINLVELVLACIGLLTKFVTYFFELDMLTQRIISVFFAYSCILLFSILLDKLFKNRDYKFPFFGFLGTRSFELYLANVSIIKICIDFDILIISKKIYFLLFLFCLAFAFLLPYLENLLVTIVSKIINCSRIEWFLFFFVLLIRVFINLDLQTITVPSDEFNTVSVAAQIMGLDWSNAIILNGYYGYTAMISYIPVFFIQKIIKDPYILYQTLLFINSVVSSLYTIIIYNILWNITANKVSKKIICILAVIASFVPQFFGCGQLTQNESTYSLCNLMVVYLLILCCDCNKGKRFVCSFFASFFAIMSYAGNNRGVIIIIALILTVSIVSIIKKRCVVDYIGLGVGLVGTALLHFKVLYPYFRSFLPKELYNTDANIIFDRIPRILTNWSDMKAVLLTFVGWVYGFITSTYGIGAIIIGFLVVYIIDFRKMSLKMSLKENVVNMMLVLWLLGTSALCIINFLDSIQGILQFNTDISYNPERVDKLFYFRYYIALAPFAVSYGIMMCKKYMEEINKKYLVMINYGFAGVILIFHSYIALYVNGMSYAPSSTNLIGLFLKEWEENYKYGTISSGRFLILTIVSIFIISTFLYYINKKSFSKWLVTFSILEVLTCIVYSGVYMAPRTRTWKNYINDEVIHLIEENVRKDIYIQNSSYAFLYQFSMPEKVIYTEFENQSVLVLEKNSNDEVITTTEKYTMIFEDDENSLWIIN